MNYQAGDSGWQLVTTIKSLQPNPTRANTYMASLYPWLYDPPMAQLPDDLSGFNQDDMRYVFISPSGKILKRKIRFVTNGKDGKVVYTVAEGDFTEKGKWRTQTEIVSNGRRTLSDITEFELE